MESLNRKIGLSTWITAALAMAVGVGWRIGWGKNIPPQIPLFYSKPWGDEQLANPIWIWAPIAMAVFMTILAAIVNKKLVKYPVLRTTITATTLIGQIILVSAIIRIIIMVM